MRASIAPLAALLLIVATAAVGGCRGEGEEVMIDGHVVAVPPAAR